MNPKHVKLLKKAHELNLSGRAEEAVAAYRAYLEWEPRQAETWGDLAGQLIHLGRLDEAETACTSALRVEPGHVSARINLGCILLRREQLEAAEAQLRSVITSDPQRLDARLILAECLMKKMDPEKVWEILDQVPQGGPGDPRFSGLKARHAEFWAVVGGRLAEKKRFEEAGRACDRALQIDPSNFSAKINHGYILMMQGQLGDAETTIRKVLVEDPGQSEARLLLVTCLQKKGELQVAEQEVAKVIQREPGSLEAHKSLDGIYYSQGRWLELQAEIDRYRQFDPDSAYLAFEQGFLELLFGEMPKGWNGYEARRKIPGLVGIPREFPQPTWRGEPFPGKTLLLCAEQGFGDTLMFARYIPLVKALGERVIVQVPPSIAEVMATCHGVDLVIPVGQVLPPFDFQLPLPSLPMVFSTDLSSIPSEIPYLDVPARVPHRQVISELLALARSHGKTRIGLVWAGNLYHSRDTERSLSAAALAPLSALPDVAWFSLQLECKDTPPLPNLVSLAPFLGDFSDTAYALSGMDLVITVDTAVAHLAGALGVPTLVLLSYQPDFRWMLDRDDSPWYPTMRLYRQPAFGDWGSVLRQLVRDLGPES